MRGWLVNDRLTCIPGTKTFWHDLLEGIPSLEDKTFGFTDFRTLAKIIEREARRTGNPDYIIRNATYFGPIGVKVRTYSLLQDIATGSRRSQQIEVCNKSAVTIFNSEYTASLYHDIRSKKVILPLGIDFDLFKPLTESKNELCESLGILPDSILFVGDSGSIKGFDILQTIIDNTDYNFCLVMKDGYSCSHPRVKVFNKVPHSELVKIYNACKLLVCTSRVETQHLSGIEAAACNLPLITSNVGCYYNRENGEWGRIARHQDFADGIRQILENYSSFSPRQYFLDRKYDKSSCILQWKNLVEGLV